jgi:hypothetical protein
MLEHPIKTEEIRKTSFDVICEFLNYQKISFDRSNLLNKYSRGLEWKSIPETPKTHIDPAVVSIIKIKKGEDSENILETKKWINAVEGYIGYLLERYIDCKISDNEWIWCAGSVVKSTDFIKKTSSGWLQLQVKNRNNTENSSSSAVRNGTDIKMWFRFYSNTGKTNWNSLPILLGKNYGMNESDFQKYVCSVLGKNIPHEYSCLGDLMA